MRSDRIDARLLEDLGGASRDRCRRCSVRPISTFLSRGRSTPANTRHGLALPLLMLGVALADDANHAVPLDHLAVLADRLHAAANFHGRSGPDENRNRRNSSQTLTVNGTVSWRKRAGNAVFSAAATPRASVSQPGVRSSPSGARPTPVPWPRGDRRPPSRCARARRSGAPPRPPRAGVTTRAWSFAPASRQPHPGHERRAGAPRTAPAPRPPRGRCTRRRAAPPAPRAPASRSTSASTSSVRTRPPPGDRQRRPRRATSAR